MTPTDKLTPEGHKPNLRDLLGDIYEVLSFFLASQRIAELEQSPLYGERDPVHQFADLQRDLITKRLIAVAITIRILDDRDPRAFDMLTDYCGTFTKNLVQPPEISGLGLRDACNKIIHARKVTFDTGTASTGQTYLHPYIYLEGIERDEPWTVNLDLVKFCRECAGAIEIVR